ncbi:MAG: hypothetical protein ACSI46_09255 [Gloeotrichia echinulata DVL01]|jgi:hypothetical protein|nr:hypothetical protein [Gloeotrichia echinulata DEX184]
MNKLFINLSLKGQSTDREFGYVRYIAGDWGLGTQRPLSASLGTGLQV